MNKFELFTLIYMALDAFYDQCNTPEEINVFLSDMCPFTFKDENSAVPGVYQDFNSFIGDRQISIENSFELAKNYIEHLSDVDVRAAFNDRLKNVWIDSCKEFLALPHKGKK